MRALAGAQLDGPLPGAAFGGSPASLAPAEPAGGDASWVAAHLVQQELRAVALNDLAASGAAMTPTALAKAVGAAITPEARGRLQLAATFALGAVIEATVRQNADVGVVLELAHGFSGFVMSSLAGGCDHGRGGKRARKGGEGGGGQWRVERA